MHMTYCLNLPQDTVYTLIGQMTLAAFSTPRKARTLVDVNDNADGHDAWSDVGLPTGTDVLEDYELKILVLLPTNKRNALSQRSAALKANTP